MTNSNNPSAVRSQAEITQALISLMRKHPYSEITVKQVILEARLARKTFYRNFESKDDVLMSLIKKVFLDYFNMVNNALSDPLTAVFAFADKNRELLLLLDKNCMMYLLLNFMNEFAPTFLKMQNKELNPFFKLFEGLDSNYLIAMNTGALLNVITLWVHRGMTDPPEKVKQTLVAYLRRIKQAEI